MSTASAEPSSSQRMISSIPVAALQITPTLKHGLCVMKRLHVALETHLCLVDSLGKGRMEEHRLHPCFASLLCIPGGLILGWVWEGKPCGSLCKEVIVLMNVGEKNYVYRHLPVNTQIYCSLRRRGAGALWWFIVTVQVNKM